MSEARRVSLFRNGKKQAIHIPREFELPGKEAVMRREGDRLVIEPASSPSLLQALAAMEPIDEPFPVIEELPHDPVEL